MPANFSNREEYTKAEIPMLGRATVPSPLTATGGESWVNLLIDHELVEEFTSPRGFAFEPAGAREKLFFSPGAVKAGIVTCGGLCPGINNVIRSLAHTLYYEYGAASVTGFRYGLRGLVAENGLAPLRLTLETVQDIHKSGGTILGTSRGPQDWGKIAENLENMGLSMLFVIGGDGTMKAAAAINAALREREARIAIIGIPKTIDNDINFIPRSFGFSTAVSKTAEALASALTEAKSVEGGIGIVKTMGRESGFITAHAAVSLGDVDFALVPEVPVQLDGEHGLLAAVARRVAAQGYVLIAVAEGAGQDILQSAGGYDASGNRQLGDIVGLLKEKIAREMAERKLPCYFKLVDPSYMVRSVPVGNSDRIYCELLGQYAVHAAMAGKTGMVIANIMDKYVHLPLDMVTKRRRKMSPGSGLWRAVATCARRGGE